MSKRESISRYSLIIKKLRKHPATYKEISEYLAIESGLQGYNFNVSKRTLQRDREDIRSLYSIDIQYDFKRKVYYIDFDQQPELNERILEAFDTFNALNIADRLSDFIHFEKRKPQGTENLHGLLHAIQNQFQISFSYSKYWEEQSNRNVEPYALKEFKNRWYVIANDLNDNKVKSFALDRLSELEITKKHFQTQSNFDVNEHYKYSFGIISPNDKKPQEVILSFTHFQGKYIKSLPIHESQVVLIDNEAEIRIKLTLFVTLDFIMEVLSHGQNVKVIQPQSLINKIKKVLEGAINQY